MHTRSSLLGGVALGVFLAASIGVSAEAKPVKKKHSAPSETQKQIDELREQVQFLKDRLDQQAAVNQQSQAQLQQAEAAAEAAKAQAAASAQEAQAAQAQIIQTIPAEVKTAVAANTPKPDGKIHYKGLTITLGGFAEMASIYRSHDETADIATNFAKIPFANDRAGQTPEDRFSARQSRYSMLVQGNVTPEIQAGFYGEFDFIGAAQTANANESSSYNLRIRHLYSQVDWNDIGWHFLAGSTWSLVTMNTKGITPRNELTPPQIDAQYLAGFDWARQPQLRVTKDFDDKQVWVALSLENAQTTFGNTGVASGVTLTDNQAPTSGYFSGTNYSINSYPDIVGKIAFEPKLADRTLHIELFGLGRAFSGRLNYAPKTGNQAAGLGLVAGNSTDTEWGGGFGAGVVFTAVPKFLDVQASFLAGNGIGRYGSAGLPDVTAKPNGQLVGIPETMWLAGGTLHPTPKVDVYAFAGQEIDSSKTFAYDGVTSFGYGTLAGSSNAGCYVEGGSCSAVNKQVDEYTLGFWHRFYQGSFGRLQWGVQYSYLDRQAFADQVGLAPKAIENMVFTSFRYYPF